MKPLRVPRTLTFKGMDIEDKLFIMCLALVAVALFAYGIYEVGLKGLYILGGAIVLVIVTEVMRKAELKSITDIIENQKSSLPEAAAESYESKSDLVQKVIDKRKKHRHRGLLETVMHDELVAGEERDEEQARKDHEELVEMARKKAEAMYSKPKPSDPKFKKENFEPAGETYKQLLQRTIVPQWELAKKDKKEEK